MSIFSEDPVPTASMANVTANERAGTMTVTLMLSHPSHEDIQYIANHHAVTGTATRDEDYVYFIPGAQEYITVSAGQLNQATSTSPSSTTVSKKKTRAS